jgi:hypothetical protein
LDRSETYAAVIYISDSAIRLKSSHEIEPGNLEGEISEFALTMDSQNFHRSMALKRSILTNSYSQKQQKIKSMNKDFFFKIL